MSSLKTSAHSFGQKCCSVSVVGVVPKAAKNCRVSFNTFLVDVKNEHPIANLYGGSMNYEINKPVALQLD